MKTLVHSRFVLLSILLAGLLGTALAVAALLDEDAATEDLFNRDIYEFHMASRVTTEVELVEDYEYRQASYMPLLLPDRDETLVLGGGVVPVPDWSAFSETFTAGLVPVERDGITYWPVSVIEDVGTNPRRRLILNVRDEVIAELPVPKDYKPAWWLKETRPDLYETELTAELAEYQRQLEAVFDGRRLIVEYDLIDHENLVKLVWRQSIEALLQAEQGGEGGGMMMSMGATSYSNIQFVAIARAPAKDGVVMAIGYPEQMTNVDVCIFAAINLVDPDWELIAVTNTPATTNRVEYHDTDATNHVVRFYRAACFAGTLHPQAGDFETGKVGRVMISTLHDDHYYTATDTSTADEPAQTEDGKVTITAHLPKFCAGKAVYFRVVTPDPDDLSPYEPDTNGGDNRDTTVGAGALSAGSDTAALITINGEEVAAAEVELTITDQYAGDNYQVEYSLESDFAHIFDRTVVMVAWKRIYIEEDRMYRKGADLASDFSPDTNALPDSVTVVSRSYGGGLDLSIGDEVLVFDADCPEGEEATVTNIVDTTLYLDVDLTNAYDAGYGTGDKGAAVAVPDVNGDEVVDVFDANTAFLTNAYGSDATVNDNTLIRVRALNVMTRVAIINDCCSELLPVFSIALHDASPQVRMAAVVAVGRTCVHVSKKGKGSELAGAVDQLVPLLADADKKMQVAAAAYLIKCGSVDLVPEVLQKEVKRRRLP